LGEFTQNLEVELYASLKVAFSMEDYTGVDFEKLAGYSVHTVLQPTVRGFKSHTPHHLRNIKFANFRSF
jgi:hypothetical protein